MMSLVRAVKQPVIFQVRASTAKQLLVVRPIQTVHLSSSSSVLNDRTTTTNSSRLGIRLIGSDILSYTDALLRHGITLFDSFGCKEEALCQALETVANTTTIMEPKRITVLARVGYRTSQDTNNQRFIFPQDVWLNDDTTEACHNIGPEYIHYYLTNSPLVKLKQQLPSLLNLVVLVHNPETQATTTTIRDRLRQSFRTLEQACLSNQISSYGVCSNGLSLQESHPLHLNWKDVLEVASEAATTCKTNTSNFQAFQLPANLLETHGLDVADQIQKYMSNLKTNNNTSYYSNNTVDIYVSRPLTCYADQGVGKVSPISCLDYEMDLPTTTTTRWTHVVPQGVVQSQYYHPAFNTAMSHFDAEGILQVQKERPLTVDERETVQGCRLLQQLLYDLDTSLSKSISFQDYENDLHTKVIPLIHNAFEELDDTSAHVLQTFFKAHGAAIRVSTKVVLLFCLAQH